MILRGPEGQLIRLTEPQLRHIHERHSEMSGMEWAIGETLGAPDAELPSARDPDSVVEYYKWFSDTIKGDKYVKVVVKFGPDDAFVLTAHFSRRIPRRGN